MEVFLLELQMEKVETAKCSKCQCEKAATEFHKNKSRPNGLQGYCKPCHNSTLRAYQRSETWKKYHNVYQANRKQNDDQFRLRHLLGNALRHGVKIG